MGKIQQVLMCSEADIRKIARRYPPVLQITPEELAERLIGLKVRITFCRGQARGGVGLGLSSGKVS